MPQPISRRPLQKLNLSNSLGAQPNAFLHFVSRQIFTPTRWMLIRQIDERHRWGYEGTDFLEDLSA